MEGLPLEDPDDENMTPEDEEEEVMMKAKDDLYDEEADEEDARFVDKQTRGTTNLYIEWTN